MFEKAWVIMIGLMVLKKLYDELEERAKDGVLYTMIEMRRKEKPQKLFDGG